MAYEAISIFRQLLCSGYYRFCHSRRQRIATRSRNGGLSCAIELEDIEEILAQVRAQHASAPPAPPVALAVAATPSRDAVRRPSLV